ncbi:MAG TPA: ABC transporter permease [Anaerolineae bacterium]|nr:ABC transporter permease [Anaerolineae bacterium]
MLRRIFAVIQKEFIQTFRDRSTLVMVLAIPVLQLFLFGYAVDMNVEHIPMVVADQSMDAASLAYVDALVNSKYFDVVGYVASQAEVIAAIDAGRAQAGIVIPPDFTTRVEQRQAQVLFLVDGSDLFTVQSGYNMASAISQSYAAEVMLEKIARSGLPIKAGLPISTRMRILYNPDLLQVWFVVPNIVAMVMQTQTIALTAAAVVRERESGTIEQLLVTPIRPTELLLGKIVPNILIAMMNILMVLGLGVYLFGVPFQGNFWLFLGLSLIFVFSGLGLGLLISTIAGNQHQVQQLVMLVIFLGVVLGGFMFPRSTMPPALYYLGYLFPLSYFIPIARGIITKGVGIELLWSSVIGMTIFGVAIMVISSRAFRQGLE